MIRSSQRLLRVSDPSAMKKGDSTMKDRPSIETIPSFMIEGSDFERGNGTGGVWIYWEKLNNENSGLKHKWATSFVDGQRWTKRKGLAILHYLGRCTMA